eukprot:1795917-Rhodomonas_salina.1
MPKQSREQRGSTCVGVAAEQKLAPATLPSAPDQRFHLPQHHRHLEDPDLGGFGVAEQVVVAGNERASCLWHSPVGAEHIEDRKLRNGPCGPSNADPKKRAWGIEKNDVNPPAFVARSARTIVGACMHFRSAVAHQDALAHSQ